MPAPVPCKIRTEGILHAPAPSLPDSLGNKDSNRGRWVRMANAPRRRSETGVYHVVVRGNGRQVLFYDDADRQAFLAMLARRTSDAGMSIWAWCLMGNHVHILLEDQRNELSHAMQLLLTGYARYFNDKTGHVGHVFQQRFFSEPIESERYLMAAVRYVHINPEKDGIEAASTYRWSSYAEYTGGALATKEPLCTTKPVLDVLDGPQGFVELCGGAELHEAGFEGSLHLSDAEAIRLADEIARARGFAHLMEVRKLPRAERDAVIRQLRGNGMTINQVERVTGVGRSIVARVH